MIPDIMSAITMLESLSGLAAFATSAEAGGFAAAGRRLGLSASAVGKAVDRLETRLGARLLTRTTRSLALTGEGEVVYRHVATILQSLQDAEREVRLMQHVPRGRLRISVPTVLGRHAVLPALGDFRTRFPDLMIDIDLSDMMVDIVREGFDVTVRLGELEDSTLRARRIGPHRFVTCAAPAYLDRHGEPQVPADLADHSCIQYRFPTTGRPEIWAFHDVAIRPVSPAIVLNDGAALRDAALAGLGIVQAPAYLVTDDINSGRLRAILTGSTAERGGVWLVWPPSRTQAPGVRAFIDFMADRIARVL